MHTPDFSTNITGEGLRVLRSFSAYTSSGLRISSLLYAQLFPMIDATKRSRIFESWQLAVLFMWQDYNYGKTQRIGPLSIFNRMSLGRRNDIDVFCDLSKFKPDPCLLRYTVAFRSCFLLPFVCNTHKDYCHHHELHFLYIRCQHARAPTVC